MLGDSSQERSKILEQGRGAIRGAKACVGGLAVARLARFFLGDQPSLAIFAESYFFNSKSKWHILFLTDIT